MKALPPNNTPPSKKPRGKTEQRRKKRLAGLERGFVRENRSDRWALRRLLSDGSNWFPYVLFAHLYDLAWFSGPRRGQAQVFFSELAEDLGVHRSTIARAVRMLEDFGVVTVTRATCDCYPDIFAMHGYPREPGRESLPGGEDVDHQVERDESANETQQRG